MDLKFFNPWADTTIGTNRLPHWDQPGATYFITIHLADSLPASLLKELSREREVWVQWNPTPWSEVQEREYHQRFSNSTEQWLEQAHGECLLRSSLIRAAVASVFTKFDRDRYWHHAWVLMPNHAHLLVSIKGGSVLPDLLKTWKGASSHAVNQILGPNQSGRRFWQKDYFDRLIRDTTHFWNCVRYIRHNPVKAKLRENDYTLYLSEEAQQVLGLNR